MIINYELRHQLLYGWPSPERICAAINAQCLADYVLQITTEASLSQAVAIFRVPKDYPKIPETYAL